MSTILKFVAGATLGVAIGAGIYIFATKESEEGILHDVKESINNAIEEGKRASAERRQQLEQELGFELADASEALPVTQPLQ